MRFDLVVVGASWGGLAALRTVLGGLPSGFAAPIVVVQHRSAESHPTVFGELIDTATSLEVREATDKQPLESGHVYLAPPDYHTLVEEDHLALSVEGAVGYARPSIDVLFESAAEAGRERCLGVVLTGASADGAQGLARIAALGGTTIVQDPASAERSEMPRAALAAVPDARVVTVEEIPLVLAALCAGPEMTP